MNKLVLIALTAASLATVSAQGLYDPEPPANSAFVRVINAGSGELKPGIDSVAYEPSAASTPAPTV